MLAPYVWPAYFTMQWSSIVELLIVFLVKYMPFQSPGDGVGELEVKVMGFSSVPWATRMPSPRKEEPIINLVPGSNFISTPGCMVRVIGMPV